MHNESERGKRQEWDTHTNSTHENYRLAMADGTRTSVPYYLVLYHTGQPYSTVHE